jgi:hypothetical protein
MNTKHRKTLAAILTRPTSASIVFADIEALIKALGGSVVEREGSRVRIELHGGNGAVIDHIRAKRQSGIRWRRLVNYWNVQE